MSASHTLYVGSPQKGGALPPEQARPPCPKRRGSSASVSCPGGREELIGRGGGCVVIRTLHKSLVVNKELRQKPKL